MNNKHKAKISVVGSGVVGQACGRGFIAHGYAVQFVDIDKDVIEGLKQDGFEAYLPEELMGNDRSNVTILTVSTPTNDGEINLRPMEMAAADLGRRLKTMDGYHLVVVRSTVVPGTTDHVVIKQIEKFSGKKAGQDFGVCMNPEYLREVSAGEDNAKPWVITIGQLDEKSGDCLAKLYKEYSCPIYRVGIREAEMQKYVHNVFNAAKISFFNEMRRICKQGGIDPDKIFPIVAKSAEGMWNPEYGIKGLGPYSGMCLPKDTQALYAWAKKQDWDMPYLKASMEVNDCLLDDHRQAPNQERAGKKPVIAPEPAVS